MRVAHAHHRGEVAPRTRRRTGPSSARSRATRRRACASRRRRTPCPTPGPAMMPGDERPRGERHVVVLARRARGSRRAAARLGSRLIARRPRRSAVPGDRPRQAVVEADLRPSSRARRAPCWRRGTGRGSRRGASSRMIGSRSGTTRPRRRSRRRSRARSSGDSSLKLKRLAGIGRRRRATVGEREVGVDDVVDVEVVAQERAVAADARAARRAAATGSCPGTMRLQFRSPGP